MTDLEWDDDRFVWRFGNYTIRSWITLHGHPEHQPGTRFFRAYDASNKEFAETLVLADAKILVEVAAKLES